jgi:hypothetical protein
MLCDGYLFLNSAWRPAGATLTLWLNLISNDFSYLGKLEYDALVHFCIDLRQLLRDFFY